MTSTVPPAVPGPAGTLLVAAIDVEWSKNYRVRGGNVPFCYSVVWLALPARATSRPGYGRVLVHLRLRAGRQRDRRSGRQRRQPRCVPDLEHASLIAGHQLCSDLAVLAAARRRAAARRHRRRGGVAAAPASTLPAGPRLLDTRYDAGHVLRCQSRRLVDVCADLRLDVTQPELRGTSMTALHRRWLERGDTTAREKITVLNLRHSLSTAAGRRPRRRARAAGRPA